MNAPPAPPNHPPRSGWLIANLVGQLAFGLLAMTICLPSMQDWPAAFDASRAQVQLSFSGFVAAYGALQLVYGAVSDRIGRRPVLLVGLVLAGVGSLLAAFAPGLWTLVLARVLQGAGSAAGMVVGRAMVQDLFSGSERTRVMAIIGMMMGLCPPLAMLVGGQVHVLLGWRANFGLMAALAVALLVAAWRGLPAPQRAAVPPPAGAWRSLFAGYARLAREPAFLLYVTVLAMTVAAFYSFLSGAPIVLAGYGVPPERIGWYVMCPPVAYVFGNLLTTRLIRQRRGDRFIMGWGQASTITGLLGVLVLGLAGLHTPLALALPMILLGIGHGLLVPPTLIGTVGLVPALAGSAAAVAGLMQQWLGALGGFFVGLVPHEGPVNLALLMLMWSGIGVAAQMVLWRVLARRGRPQSP